MVSVLFGVGVLFEVLNVGVLFESFSMKRPERA